MSRKRPLLTVGTSPRRQGINGGEAGQHGTLSGMLGRLGLVLLFAIGTNAQDEAATALLQKAEAMARGATSWRAEVIDTSQLSGRGNEHAQ